MNETKLNSDIRFSHNLFHIYRLDNLRGRVSHGGVAIVVHKSIRCEIMSSFDTETVQAIGVTVRLHNNQQLNIISAYFNGNTAPHHIGAFRRDIRKITPPNSIILANLNSKHTYWGCQRQNRAGKYLYEEMMIRNFKIFAPPSPTHYPGKDRQPSVLDILLSTTQLPVDSIHTSDDLGSDHLLILVQIQCEPSTKAFNKVKCFRKANWNKFKQILNRNIDLNQYKLSSNHTTDDIDDRIEHLTQVLNHAADSSVPTIRISPQKPGMTNQIEIFIRQR